MDGMMKASTQSGTGEPNMLRIETIRFSTDKRKGPNRLKEALIKTLVTQR
jgi:hypothetical protein